MEEEESFRKQIRIISLSLIFRIVPKRGDNPFVEAIYNCKLLS